jgi:hypothetical protein
MKRLVLLLIFFLSGEIMFGSEDIIIRYYFVECGFRPFAVFFSGELTDQNISEKIGYYKVYYEGDKLIKYESYIKPRRPDIVINGIRQEKDPVEFSWEATVNYFYNDRNRLIKIISRTCYTSMLSEINIEYTSDVSAFYRETEDGKDVYEGELLYDGDNIIFFSLADSQDKRWATLYYRCVYQNNSINIIRYTNFGNDAEWELILDQQKNIVSYNYNRF